MTTDEYVDVADMEDEFLVESIQIRTMFATDSKSPVGLSADPERIPCVELEVIGYRTNKVKDEIKETIRLVIPADEVVAVMAEQLRKANAKVLMADSEMDHE